MDFFVYGTLTDRETATTVLDSFAYRGPAVLEGLHRVDGPYPTLVPGGLVEGRILATPETGSLDRYEGVDRGLFVRVALPRVDGGRVRTYVGDPTRLGVADEWPGEGPFPERVRNYVAEHAVRVRTPEG